MKKNNHRKKRSALALLGIAIGVCAVLLIQSIGQSSTAAVSAELDQMGLCSVLVSHQDRSIPLSNDEIETLRRMDRVAHVMPLTVLLSSVETAARSKSALLFGVDPGFDQIISLQMIDGRSFNDRDVADSVRCCVISTDLANLLGAAGQVGGKVPLNINGSILDFEIVGTARTSSAGLLQGALGSYIPTMIYVPYSALYAQIEGIENQQVVVRLKSQSENDAETLTRILQRRCGKSQSYQIHSLVQEQDTLNRILSLITNVLTGIAGIALLVACLNILTTMLVQVRERRREIAIKKAIGASNGAILLEFLLESVRLSGIGAGIGIVSAAVCISAARWIWGIPATFSVKAAVIVFAISLGSGAVFGVYPAGRAAHSDPIEGLREE